MSPENLTNVYNNNPTLQSQYSLQQYLDLFGQGGTTQPDPDPDPDPTPDPNPTPAPPIQNAGGGGGGGIQGLQLTYTPGATNAPTFNPNINPAAFLTGKGRLDPMGSDVDYFNSLPANQKFNFGFKDSNIPGQKGYEAPSKYFEEPSFLQKGITGVKDFFGKFNSGPKVRGTLGDRRKAAYDAGQKLPSIFAAIGRMQSPFNPDSRNYNPNMANQLNYLEGMDGLNIKGKKDPYTGETIFTETSAPQIGRDSQSGLMKYGPGTVLEGKNVFSGFGSNDYETALEKYLEKMMGYKTKTAFQQRKIDRANQELEDYREQQKIKDQEKKEQNEREQRTREANTAARARAANPDVYASADRQGFTNPGGGFKSAGTNENFSNKSGKGRTGYRYGGRASYFDGGIASFKNGGRTGYFKGALADTKKGKSMSPGTTASGNFRGGNGGGGNNNPPPKDNTPPPKKPKPKVKKNISTGSFFPSFNFLKKFKAHDEYTDQLKASKKPNYHELGGLDFMARFPNLNPDIAKGLATGYQNVFEVGRAIADGPGGMTVGNALNKAKEESRLNAVGIDAYANPDSSLYQNYFNQDPLTGAVPFNNQSMATGGRVNYFNGGIVSLRRR